MFWGYHHLRKHPSRGWKTYPVVWGCFEFSSRILKNNQDDSWFRYILCRVPVWLWIHMVPEFWDGSLLPKNGYSKVRFVLLMEEILHHLGCKEPCKQWNIYHINWCRIPSINSRECHGCCFRKKPLLLGGNWWKPKWFGIVPDRIHVWYIYLYIYLLTWMVDFYGTYIIYIYLHPMDPIGGTCSGSWEWILDVQPGDMEDNTRDPPQSGPTKTKKTHDLLGTTATQKVSSPVNCWTLPAKRFTTKRSAHGICLGFGPVKTTSSWWFQLHKASKLYMDLGPCLSKITLMHHNWPTKNLSFFVLCVLFPRPGEAWLYRFRISLDPRGHDHFGGHPFIDVFAFPWIQLFWVQES